MRRNGSHAERAHRQGGAIEQRHLKHHGHADRQAQAEQFRQGLPVRLCQTAQVTIDENQGLRVNAIRLNREGAAARRLAWSTQLDVPNANGQVVVNGATAVFSGPGRSNAVAVGRRGENRIEAQLVQAGGKPGTWRFELAATSSLEPGSIRVVAGDVALVTGDAIVFQLKGTPGERVVFTFLTGR